MNKSTIENGQPEQVTNNEQKDDNISSAQVSANAPVVRSASDLKRLIEEKISSATSMCQAEEFAEKLTYEISYEHKKDTWRSRYTYLRKEDFMKLGWKVICIGNKNKWFDEWILLQGFKKHFEGRNFYNKETKIIFMVGEFDNGNLISINDWKYGEPKFLISLDEYKQLLILKLNELLEARSKIIDFIKSLVREHKDFLEQEENDYLKQTIINDALEKAKKEGLIK